MRMFLSPRLQDRDVWSLENDRDDSECLFDRRNKICTRTAAVPPSRMSSLVSATNCVATPSTQRDTADVALQVFEGQQTYLLYSIVEGLGRVFPCMPTKQMMCIAWGVALFFERHLGRPVGAACDQLSVTPVIERAHTPYPCL